MKSMDKKVAQSLKNDLRTVNCDLMCIYLIKYFDSYCDINLLSDMKERFNWDENEEDDLGEGDDIKKVPGIVPFDFLLFVLRNQIFDSVANTDPYKLISYLIYKPNDSKMYLS